MELIDYGGLLRRWSVLIIAGTLVAALIGYRVALRSWEAAHPHYAGTAGVVVHYVTPPGVAYIATLSTHTQTEALSAHVTEPGALSRVAARAHVALSQVQRVSTAVDPQRPLITIQVQGTTPRAAAAMAQGLAQYLAGVETQQVQAQAASLSRTVASAMAQAQQRWLAAQTHYYLVCGCIAGQSHARADPATLARLHAELDVLQANYAAAASRYTALLSNPVPVATVVPGSVSAVRAPAASPLKAVLLAAVVGLVLSSALAALLDVRRNLRPALAGARGPVHAASALPDPPFTPAKGGSGRARRVHGVRSEPAPAGTLMPGSARSVKAVLPAAGLVLLVCIGLAAVLVVERRAAPSAASHLGAPRLGTAQPAGPPTALPASPTLLLNPDAVSFGDGPTERTAHTIYVVNLGPAPVTIRTITITGPDRAAFAATDTCTRKTISVYARCTISVRVAPMTGGGTHKATLRITPNAPGSAVAAVLVVERRAAPSAASHLGAPRLGTAQPAGPPTALPASPTLLLNPDAVSFGDGPTERTAHTIYVVNLGPAPVTIRTITITGPDRAAFAATDTCTRKTISVYARCTISVRVAPMTRTGTRNATLVITPAATGNAQRVPLSA